MVARAAVLFLLWLLLVDSVHEPELITGGVVAVLAAGISEGMRPLASAPIRIRPSMLRYGYRPIVLLLTDTVRVVSALLGALATGRRPSGRFRAVRFRAGSEGSTDRARRVLTEWAASVGPNRYAIGVDCEAKVLLVHELVKASGPLDPLELG